MKIRLKNYLAKAEFTKLMTILEYHFLLLTNFQNQLRKFQKAFNDFVNTSKNPDWEKFEKLCLKIITCKLNYILWLKPIKDVSTFTVGDVFQGAHMPIRLAQMTLMTETNNIMYETENFISTKLITKYTVMKVKKNEKGIDGFLPTFTSDGKKYYL